DDPSAKDKKSAGGEVMQQGNKGDLGYFTAFDMVYSFESGAYNTPVGKISMPVRTEFGYHLILVHDKRPAFGKCKATQIVIPFNKSPNLNPSEKAKDREQIAQKVNDIYNEIINGLPFEDAVEKYGEEGTNGKLPLFGCNRFEGDFVKELYGLKENEMSKPIQTSYGLHIVKIDELVPVRIDEEAKSAIRTKILQDTRSFKSREAFIERVKKENGFKEIEDKKAKTTPIQDFYTALDSNIFDGTYESSMVKHLTRPMFVFAEKTYTQQDFAQYLETRQFTNIKDIELPVLVNFAYKRFIDNTVMDYENRHAETKYPDFADLMRDYKEGIMLYELNERKIWKRPENDSIGLNDFYETIKHTQLYPVRIKAEYIRAVDASATKKAESMLRKGKPIQDIMTKMNKKKVNLVLDTVVYWQEQNKQFDQIINWEQAAAGNVFVDKSENELVRIKGILQPSPKPLSEIRGLVMSEYQNKLETDWLKSLYDIPIWIDYETIISLCRKK
ncbi:MAG: peptidyl-prolyl cis-trans isomerase, partial [Lentimicrobiaceae bacterium]|nr:peptidyl-prolyl cis-trans isomerase [Lentimicrobiaceae bacterium]